LYKRTEAGTIKKESSGAGATLMKTKSSGAGAGATFMERRVPEAELHNFYAGSATLVKRCMSESAVRFPQV